MFKVLQTSVILLSFCLCGCQSGKTAKEQVVVKPNIIYILADDLGYADLGSYGQKKIETPNLDRLASGGLRFTNHYTGSTVCAPSRSALMTGLHTGHTPVRGNREYQPEGQHPMPDTVVTIPKLLKKAGYVTGAFGKWGLGFIGTSGDPNAQGFDRFFGYNCQRQAHRYYPEYLWSNDTKVFLPGNDWTKKETYAPDVIQQHALNFIEEHKTESFFMYVPLVIPHAELAAPEDSLIIKYRKRFAEERPYVGKEGADYGPDLAISKYQSQPEPRATYAAMVQRMDVYVGQIMQKLQQLGLAENTIVMFASDNGPHLEGGNDPHFFNSNGILRGHKRDLYEGGIRTPFIVHWPKRIKGGRVSSHTSAFWDVLPTLADIAGIKALPPTDGISFLPTLLNKGKQTKHNYLYWEFVERGGRQAVRKGKWKAVRMGVKRNSNAAIELYDLSTDPSELNNVASLHPEIVRQMATLMEQSHTLNPIFPLFSSEQMQAGNSL